MKISCGIYLINSDNKLLIGHPTNHKANIWAIPKGRVNEGETNQFDVAKRELLEETNIDLNKFKISKIVEFEMIRYRETNKYLKGFFVKVNNSFSDENIKCTSMVHRDGIPSFPEFDDFKWVTIDESRNLLHQFQISNLDKCQKLISKNESMNFYEFTFLKNY